MWQDSLGTRATEASADMRDSMHIPFSSDLWPTGLTPGRSGPRTYLVISRQGSVRALVPVDVPRVAQRALRDASAPESRSRSALRTIVGLGARAVLATRMPLPDRSTVSTEDDRLEQHLAGLVGLDVAYVAVRMGPRRANQKPVATVYDRGGRPHAVAKFGCDELTRRLVSREADALRALSERRTGALDIPGLLHEGTWGGLDLVVQSMISFPGRHRLPSEDHRIQAEHAVVATGDVGRAPLRNRSYAHDLAERLQRLGGDRASESVAHSGRRLLATLADRTMDSGGWHGDWSPQNICATHAGTGAWDWERWHPDRPAGFDALHFRTQTLLSDGDHSELAGQRLLDEAPLLLAPHQPGVTAEVARSLAGLYLAEVGHRYLSDRQQDTPSAAGRMDAWLVPALLSTVQHGPAQGEHP
jgi:hypothetical protein